MFGQVSERATDVNVYPEGMSMQHVGNDDLKFRRHRRMRELPELTYEFTKEPDLLHQYYVLRSLVFKQAHGVSIPAEEDFYDKQSEILIVRRGKQVIAGVRMTCSHPHTPRKFSLKKYGINIETELRELDLENHSYCEISKMAVLEEFQNSNVTSQMMDKLFKRGRSKGISYGFSMVPTAVYRLHRATSRRLGYICERLSTIKFPKDIDGVDGRNFSMLIFDVERSFEKHKKPQATHLEDLIATQAP